MGQLDPVRPVPPANGGMCRLLIIGTTGPGGTVPPANGGIVPPGLSVSGSCNAVALSDATNNSSSASSSGHL